MANTASGQVKRPSASTLKSAAAATSGRERASPATSTRPVAAARINALTEIETLIGELKELSPDAKCLAIELEKLLSRYDMDEIIALIDQIPAGVG